MLSIPLPACHLQVSLKCDLSGLDTFDLSGSPPPSSPVPPGARAGGIPGGRLGQDACPLGVPPELLPLSLTQHLALWCCTVPPSRAEEGPGTGASVNRPLALKPVPPALSRPGTRGRVDPHLCWPWFSRVLCPHLSPQYPRAWHLCYWRPLFARCIPATGAAGSSWLSAARWEPALCPRTDLTRMPRGLWPGRL